MFSRLAARAVTGPFAFFIAGVADLLSFWLAWLRGAVGRRLARLRGTGRAVTRAR